MDPITVEQGQNTDDTNLTADEEEEDVESEELAPQLERDLEQQLEQELEEELAQLEEEEHTLVSIEKDDANQASVPGPPPLASIEKEATNQASGAGVGPPPSTHDTIADNTIVEGLNAT